MNERDRLLAAVIAAPTDAAPRRAYADAIRAAEPERAELIDLQLAIRDAVRAGKPPPDPALRRAYALTDRRASAWAGPLAKLVGGVWYVGGFVEGVTASPAQLRASAAAIVELAPVRRLRITKLRGEVPSITSLPLLAQLVSLDVSSNQLTDDEIATLVASPHLRRLQKLSVQNNPIGIAALRAIARADLPALRYVETANTNAPIIERFEEWSGSSELGFTRTRNQLREELGTRPWLETLAEPYAEAL